MKCTPLPSRRVFTQPYAVTASPGFRVRMSAIYPPFRINGFALSFPILPLSFSMTRIPVACFIVAVPVFAAAANLPEWPQFGGPNRNFIVDSAAVADVWPVAGPKKLWSRPMGEGYSGIAVDSGTLYTMYRKGNDEVAVALDAA